MEKHLIVDGRNLLYQAHYGLPPLTTSNGHQSGALFGFLKILRRIIITENPDFVLVCWDGEPVYRRGLYPEYKRNRDYSKINFNAFNRQFDAAMDFLRVLGIAQVLHSELEADDLIAAYVLATTNQYSKNCCILVASADKDFWQLISKTVSCLNPRTDSKLTYKNFEEKTEFNTPLDYLEYRILVGDSSDNIPGLIAGVGDKRARAMVNDKQYARGLLCNGVESETIERQYALIDLTKMVTAVKQKIFSVVDGMFSGDVMRLKEFNLFCSRWEFNNIVSDEWLLPFKTAHSKSKNRVCFNYASSVRPKRVPSSLFKKALNKAIK